MEGGKSSSYTIQLSKSETQFWIVSFLILSGLAIIVFAQNYVKYASSVEDFSVSLSLLYNLIVFATYSLFTPLIIRTVRRFPTGKGGKSMHLFVHLGLSVLLGLIHMLFCNLILYGIDLSSSPFFPRFITKYLTNVIHFHVLAYWAILGFVTIRGVNGVEKGNELLQRFVIQDNKHTRFLKLEEVYWIEALDHYQKLHTENGFFLYRDSMCNLELNLPKEKFKRIHRSAIVNLERMERLKKSNHQLMIELQNGQEVVVGKSFRTAIRHFFSR
ncbi:MAG: LytTR family DNA-binding domain-containing protein [Cyclobacteriaceae bacterium]